MAIVYVLTNEAMPGLIKIGITDADLPVRMLQLDTTSVPLPFECYYAAEVTDAPRVEKAFHTALGDHRVRKSREFFGVDPYRAKAVLELVAIREVTPNNTVVESSEDAEALEQSKQMRPNFRFSMVDIPPGATIEFGRDPTKTAVVIDDKSITFRDQTMSLSQAALLILHEMGFQWKTVAGPDQWLYNGETLSERRIAIERGQTEGD